MANRLIHVPNLQNLKKVRGNLGAAYYFMQCGFPPLGMTVWDDHFLGDTIRGDATSPGMYEVKTGVDGAISILADQTGGVAEIRASDGNGADNEYCGIALPELSFKGDNGCGMAVRFNLDDIDTVKTEIGFTDVTTDAGAVNSLASNTFTATNSCVWVRDTDDNAYWQCAGTKDGTPATKNEPELTPIASTFEWLIVNIEGDDAFFYRLDANARQTRGPLVISDAIEGGTKISPWLFIQLRTGTIDRNMLVDRIVVWGNDTDG